MYHSLLCDANFWAFLFSIDQDLAESARQKKCLQSLPERPRGQLKAALRALAEKTWTHPVSGREVRFAAVTIERWYYTAQRAKDDPVGVLRRAVRRDCGKVTLATALAELLRKLFSHPGENGTKIAPG